MMVLCTALSAYSGCHAQQPSSTPALSNRSVTCTHYCLDPVRQRQTPGTLPPNSQAPLTASPSLESWLRGRLAVGAGGGCEVLAVAVLVKGLPHSQNPIH